MILRAAALLLLAPQDGVEFFEQKIRPVLVERCHKCHSDTAEKLKANLRLDSREGLLKGGDRGPAVVPGNPAGSLLLQAVRHADDDLKMPPKEKKLAPEVIADLEAWVKLGAPMPAARPPGEAATRGPHWAFAPPRDPLPPPVKMAAWPRTPVDRFILARLEEKGLSPSPAADRRTLLRRATFDLHGLPPTAEEFEAFERDGAPDAFAKVVDRLLASPRYGERWGRYWLDAARYADTKGYVYADRDESRFVHSHVYRDWVVRALNEDLPYDRFLMLQIAADRLAGDDPRDLAAMGFLTVGRRFINNIHDIIDDRIDTLSRATMGLTVSCARCHDHKFDPIPTKDYYALYGVFSGSTERTVPAVASPERTPETAAFEAELKKRRDALAKKFAEKSAQLLERLRAKTPGYLTAVPEVEKFPTEEFYSFIGPDDLNPVIVRQWHAYLLGTRKGLHPVFAPWHAYASHPADKADAWVKEHAVHLNPRVAAAFAGPPAGSLREAAATYGKLFAEIYEKSKGKAEPLADPAEEALRQVLTGSDSPIALPPGSINEVEWFFEEAARVELAKLQLSIDRWILDAKGTVPHAAILEDRPLQHNPRVFRRGNPAQKGDEVPRRSLTLLGGKVFEDGSGRLELARAIAGPDNPLTARVAVNRAWLHHFGEGLVRTPSDFGFRSEPPTHPELLDWLARRFAADGGSMKSLHRLIMLSAVYQQSSEDRPEARRADPDNRLIWRMTRRRLDFEALRDSLLAASGRLDLTMGGRPVQLGASSRRRTVYGYVDRLNLPGMFRVFDFASPDAHSAQRHATTVPQQALFLLNSPFILEQARALARRVEAEADPAARVQALYRLAYGRPATARELELARGLAEAPVAEQVVVKPSAWSYGTGDAEFRPLPHFTGSAWQGGLQLPDPQLGWVYLTAQGGHAGNDAAHPAVRRWTAPKDGTVTITGTLAHKAKEGDGVRGRIVSSRAGELASWSVHKMEAKTEIKGVEVKAGDTLDFAVDCRSGVSHDEFAWAPVLEMAGASWNAASEFAGPPPVPLSPLEQIAQVLLLANEFVFID